MTENHDVRRAPTRYGGRVVHREVATSQHLALGRVRSLAALYTILALPGITYIYNGQELGLEEVIDLDDRQRQDPHFHRTNGEHLGRDGCRVPMPWKRVGTSLGFGADSGRPAWLTQPKEWSTLSVEAQESDDGSMLNRLRTAVSVRREHAALLHGTLEWKTELCVNGVVAFARVMPGEQSVLCVANMGDTLTPSVHGRMLCASGNVTDGKVPPDTTAWFAID
ncbi:MAG: hypothetical protein ACKOXX_07590 [Actinomycetota bacterium]